MLDYRSVSQQQIRCRISPQANTYAGIRPLGLPGPWGCLFLLEKTMIFSRDLRAVRHKHRKLHGKIGPLKIDRFQVPW